MEKSPGHARSRLPQDQFSSLREEVSFSLIRLGLQKGLKGLGKALTTASQRLPGVEEQQYEVWKAQVSADAQITFADDGLDDFVVKLANEAKAAGVFELFFAEAPTSLERPVLGDQLQAMRPWVKQLEAQSDKRFAGMPAELKTLLAQADAAIKSQEGAPPRSRSARWGRIESSSSRSLPRATNSGRSSTKCGATRRFPVTSRRASSSGRA